MHSPNILYDKTRLARLAWLLVAFLSAGSLRSQPLLRLNSVSYNVNEGLLQSHVADIAEDGNGFMWVSTGSGVQRFDGKRFHQVMVDGGSKGLPDDKYVHFLRLANGNLWITHSKGINEYDIHTNSFKKIYEFSASPGGDLSDNLIYAVLEEGPLVWCATPYGLLAIDKSTTRLADSIPYSPVSGPQLVSPLSPIQNFFVAAGRNICAFLAPAEIRIINTDTKKTTSVKASHEQRYFHAIEKLNDDSLLVASSLGIEKMSIATGRFTFVCPYIVPPERDHQSFPLHLYRLKNDLFIIVFSGEVFELDTHTGRYRAHLVNLQQQSFLNNGFINGCMADRFHNLWLATVSDGIKKINYNFSGFRYFGTADMKNNFVKSIYVDKTANQVFCGTFNSGLYIYDTSQQLTRHIDAFPGSPAPYTVCAIDKTGPQQYLVYLTGGWYAYLLNTKDFSIRKLPVSVDKFHPGDKFDYYLSYLKTGDSAALISTDFSNYHVQFLNGTLQLHRVDTLPSPSICAYTDRRQRVWIGGAGSYFLLEGNNTPVRSFNLPGKILCRCFWNDRLGRMWMGTEKGLFRLNNDGSILSVLHQSNGLPDDCIYSIREDRKGNLWFSHNKGLTCMSRSGSFLHFSKNDGLQENEFNTNTSFETPDGELYFGGVNGISSFYPEAVSSINELPNVLLSGIRVNDEYWKEDTAYWSIQQLQLPYYNNIVSFEFTALGLRNPDQYNFQYQMEGLDPEWINAGNYPAPRYVLSPGKYMFRYYAGNSLDKHTRKFKELLIVIDPPFWNTWWFTALVIAGIIVLLMFIIQLYDKRSERRHNNELETHLKIQQERERISRELHDNIGAQLSFISSSIDWISAPPVPMDKAEELNRLSVINDTAKLVISDLRETIWALKKETIQLDEMADRLKLFIQLQRTLQPGMEMTITENIQNNISFSSTDALHIFRICQEAIMNCIRHADASKLCVSIQSGPGRAFMITIEDNGRGFSDTPPSPEHYGLENMQHRAAELGALLLINSADGKGTSLILRNI
ncbi:MAG TPA: two-component regulator propeller domain-containing protein [Chitinophagaceae bacterium]